MENLRILICVLFSFIGLILNSQGYWQDSYLTYEDIELEEGDFLVLDTLKFNVNSSYVSGLNINKNISELTKILNDNKELDVKVYVLMNTNYDTITSHFLRTRGDQIIRSLKFFNVNPLRFQVKDSVVLDFDKEFRDDEAFRKIIVRFEEPASNNSLVHQINQIYLNQDEYELQRYLLGLSECKEDSFTNIPDELEDYTLEGLLDKYYSKFYLEQSNSNYILIPQSYHVELGEVSKYTYEGEYLEDLEITTRGFVEIFSIPKSSYTIEYCYPAKRQREIYLDERTRRALEEFLGYEFLFDLDTMTNTPSNIKPIGETKEKLEFLKKQINPKYEYAERGRCNSYLFWDFRWEIKSPYTVNLISIDEATREAYIETKDEHSKVIYFRYQLEDGKWVYKEVIGNKEIRSNRKSIYFIGIIFWGVIVYIMLRNE